MCHVIHAYELAWPLNKIRGSNRLPRVACGQMDQMFIFSKNATISAHYMVNSLNSCIFVSLKPSKINMESKIKLGSFGVTGVKIWFDMLWLKCYYSFITSFKSYGIRSQCGVCCGQIDQIINFIGSTCFYYTTQSCDSYTCTSRDLARILILPIFLNSSTVQNSLKWCKMVQNGNFSCHLKWRSITPWTYDMGSVWLRVFFNHITQCIIKWLMHKQWHK